MSRKMRAQGKSVIKISRDGLVEKNLVDGAEQPAGSAAADTAAPAREPDEPLPGRTRFHRRADKYDKRLSKVEGQLLEARAAIPKREVTRTESSFDETVGQVVKTKVRFTEDMPKPKVKIITEKQRRHKAVARRQIYSNVRADMDDTADAEALHTGVKFADYSVSQTARLAHNAVARVRTRPYDRVQSLEDKAARLERKAGVNSVKAAYKDFERDNPHLTSNPVSRWQQKRRIKREYAKRARDGYKAGTLTGRISAIFKKGKGFIAQRMKSWAVAAGSAGMVFFLVLNAGSCSSMCSGPGAAVIGSSYTAADEDIAAVTAQYTKLEAELQKEIDNIEATHPGYDEYRFDVDEIGHDPQELMAYLTAKYAAFTFAEVEGELQDLFKVQYQLSLMPTTETEVETWTDENGQTHEETHVRSILNVRLSNARLSGLIEQRLDDQQMELFDLYMETKGNKEYFKSPVGGTWQPMTLYGYTYKDGAVKQVDGMEIYAASSGLYAAFDGVVTDVSGDSFTITNKDGYSLTYGNLGGLYVSVGQEVEQGASLGSAGGYLYITLSYKGTQLNPYFYFEGCDNSSLGGASLVDAEGNPYMVPADALSDPAFAALMAEAEKYLGYPYVSGGSNPSESFDCSGFISWVVNQSGTASIGRTTAQGIYNKTAVVSSAQAMPGDLIFFTNTGNSGRTVTHVGLYVGDGVMLHSDSLGVRYSKISTPYWTKNFYAFGRL